MQNNIKSVLFHHVLYSTREDLIASAIRNQHERILVLGAGKHTRNHRFEGDTGSSDWESTREDLSCWFPVARTSLSFKAMFSDVFSRKYVTQSNELPMGDVPVS